MYIMSHSGLECTVLHYLFEIPYDAYALESHMTQMFGCLSAFAEERKHLLP